MPMSSPSNSGKNTLLSRIGTVKKVWSSEEEGEFDPKRGCVADTVIESLVFFFLSLFPFFPLFLPILFVTFILRDTDQTTIGIHPSPSMIQHPTFFLLLHLLSGFQYKAYGSDFFFHVQMSNSLSKLVKRKDFRLAHIL
jgi:hypothetical protein